MILGVGIDLVEVSRMERILAARWARRFLDRVFSEEEQTVSNASAAPAQSYAARFAAKEALVKALGTGFSKGITPSLICVSGGERTPPKLVLTGLALAAAQTMNVDQIHVSITHTRNCASALVIVERLQRAG
jgi:holo-[acyl-carrier protein] synthase